MPGTGKTATTMEVIQGLKKNFKFSFKPINAMSLTNPNLVYTIIYEKITGRKAPPASAALFLDEFFKKKDKTKLWFSTQIRNSSNKEKKNLEKEAKKQCELIRVILIDELDALMTKKQTLLYNLFDWPCH